MVTPTNIIMDNVVIIIYERVVRRNLLYVVITMDRPKIAGIASAAHVEYFAGSITDHIQTAIIKISESLQVCFLSLFSLLLKVFFT